MLAYTLEQKYVLKQNLFFHYEQGKCKCINSTILRTLVKWEMHSYHLPQEFILTNS